MDTGPSHLQTMSIRKDGLALPAVARTKASTLMEILTKRFWSVSVAIYVCSGTIGGDILINTKGLRLGPSADKPCLYGRCVLPSGTVIMEQEMDFPQTVSTKLSKMSLNAVALLLPFTETKGPSHNPLK